MLAKELTSTLQNHSRKNRTFLLWMFHKPNSLGRQQLMNNFQKPSNHHQKENFNFCNKK